MSANEVIRELRQHVLLDGFKLVFDAERSHGPFIVDAVTGREFIDLYGFYASQPIGFNHPYFDRAEVKADLLRAAKVKVANSDVGSIQYATFVKTFASVMGLPPLNRLFFIDGGALAVENALKAAMDWKVRKNIGRGLGERGTEIIHFEHAFHGRSGYALSLTNTDPRKTDYFPKFPWPRIPAPTLDFSMAPQRRTEVVAEKENLAEERIRAVVKQKGIDIAAIIVEPIQGEGGDNHFRGEFLRVLRRICDENEMLLIFDEVQCGMGITGRNWCCEHFGVCPDLLAFGKKAQVCGVMAGPRVDEVKDNCFRLASRISSTWGANFTDFVRSTHYLRIIQEEQLVRNAEMQGNYFLNELYGLARRYPMVQAVRGRGLMLAFDLPNPELREVFCHKAYEKGSLVVRSGTRAIRLRPVLDISSDVIDRAIRLLDAVCAEMSS
ncbi:MAG TPA: L-lysine 6-transaminase [Candidatus Limnocylindrales bacterium]|nr:L-lysine 6-transaminase [Candidatus Limnocylindrales bacterium]